MSASVKKAVNQKELFNVKKRSRPLVATLILFGGTLVLILAIGLSISFGAADIDLRTVWGAVFAFNPDLTPHQIIQEIRLPRVLGAAMVGACFAVAGAIMQGMTRNPLADSGLLGLNAGAVFMLAVCFAFFSWLAVYVHNPVFILRCCTWCGASLWNWLAR